MARAWTVPISQPRPGHTGLGFSLPAEGNATQVGGQGVQVGGVAIGDEVSSPSLDPGPRACP